MRSVIRRPIEMRSVERKRDATPSLYIFVADEDDMSLPVVRLVMSARGRGLSPQVIPIEPNFSGFRILLAERSPAVFVLCRSLRIRADTLGTLIQAFQLRAVEHQRLRIVSLDDDPEYLARTLRADLEQISSRAERAAADLMAAKQALVRASGSTPASPRPQKRRRAIAWLAVSFAVVAACVYLTHTSPRVEPLTRMLGDSARTMKAAQVASAGIVGNPMRLAPAIEARHRSPEASTIPSLTALVPVDPDGLEPPSPPKAVTVAVEDAPASTSGALVRPRGQGRGVDVTQGSCRTQVESVQRAAGSGDWPTVLSALDRGRCWTNRTAFLRLRVRALYESGNWWDCVLSGSSVPDPTINRYVQKCAQHMGATALRAGRDEST